MPYSNSLQQRWLFRVALLLFVAAIWMQPATAQDFTLAAMGDAIITRRVSVFNDEPFTRMVTLIRGADAAFANCEISFLSLAEFRGYPQAEDGGNWELATPVMAEEIKWLGIDLMSRANNHTTDWGAEGLLETNRLLDRLGIIHAGAGLNLGMARLPGYLETSKGRVALISLASTFTPMSRAGEPRPDVPGRPGLSALRTTRTLKVNQALFEEIRRLDYRLRGTTPPDPLPANTRFTFPQALNVEQADVKDPTWEYKMNEKDVADILRSVKSARMQADWVVVTIHAHESGRGNTEPADFLPAFAHAAIDAGADMFIGHGPHVLRGIEIYKGRPIFYSLGNFIFQNETIEPMPSDMYERYGLGSEALAADLYSIRFRNDTTGFPTNAAYWESVVAMPRFSGKQLAEIQLYPISLGFGKSRSQRGTPRLADSETGGKILEGLDRLSQPFGVRVAVRNGVGIITPR